MPRRYTTFDLAGLSEFQGKITAPDGAASDAFGFSVSQSGNILAVETPITLMVDLPCWSCLSLSVEANGTAIYLNKVTAPMEPQTIDSETPFLSRAIFWPSGHTCRSGGLANAGAAYLYQVEANGSAT